MIAEALAGVEVIQQTINDRGSFGEYVRGVLDSRELVQFFVLLGAGMVGASANYLQKWLRDEITGSLWAYVAHQYPKRTLLALSSYFSYCVVTVLSPALDGAGWTVVVNLGFTTGLAIDALVNKSERKVWTDAERGEKTLPGIGQKP